MGVGCGGGVGTKSFDIGLDSGSPTVTVKNGQRDFPYKVSESDPEVFYVNAHTTAHDVRWDLTLDWSSGARHGTVRIDDNGHPFRTSADVGPPAVTTTRWAAASGSNGRADVRTTGGQSPGNAGKRVRHRPFNGLVLSMTYSMGYRRPPCRDHFSETATTS